MATWITKRELLEVVAAMPEDRRYEYGLRAFALSAYITTVLLGRIWQDRYMHWDSSHAGMFKISPPGTLGMTRPAFWHLELAETLFNLRHVCGFRYVLREMKQAADDAKVQATFAELDFGRLLRLHRIPFRFRRPQSKTQQDYDYELRMWDGTVVCADAKCKLEDTAVSAKSIENTLRKGYTQLPPDRPSMLFVKVSQHWLESPEIMRELIPISRKFLRDVSRIVSLAYFVPHLSVEGGLQSRQMYLEINNDRNKFDPNRDWHIFEDHPPPKDDWHDLPPFWTRILGFPDGLPRRVTRKAPDEPEMTAAEIARHTDPVMRRLLQPGRRKRMRDLRPPQTRQGHILRRSRRGGRPAAKSR
jgi:hypothetical protein